MTLQGQPREASGCTGGAEPDLGVQLVELGTLDGVATLPHSRVIAVALYHWVADTLNQELQAELRGVNLEVVRITYLGSYVGLGLRYPEQEARQRTSSADVRTDVLDRGPLVESFGDALVRERLGEFLSYLERHSHLDWTRITAELFKGEHDVLPIERP